MFYLSVADDGEDQRHASRSSRSASDTSSRRDSMDSTFSASEFDDSGTGDNSMVSAGDTSLSGADGQSSSEEQAGGDVSPFTVPAAAATKDPVRLKCREMLSAALKTPREFCSCFCVYDNYSVSKKRAPVRTCGNFSKMVGNFSTKFHTRIISTLDYEFLFNYLQL